MRRVPMMLAGAALGPVLFLSHSMILAQERRVGDPGGFQRTRPMVPIRTYHSDPAFHWIAVEAVQDDLKLSEKQREQIKTARESLDGKERDLNKDRRNASTPRPNARSGQDSSNDPTTVANPVPDPQKAREWVNRKDALEREIDRTYSKILTRAQLARLKQIHWQHLGPFAIWDDPEFARRLNIVEQQRLQLDMVQADIAAEKRRIRSLALAKADAIRSDPKLSDAEREKQIDQNRTKMLEQSGQLEKGRATAYGRVLTRRQKELYKKLLGPPFDVSKLEEWQIRAYKQEVSPPSP